MKAFIRTAKEFDLDQVCKHLLVVGDLKGDCFNCKEIGLDYVNIKNCPKCKTEFNFIASRRSGNVSQKFLTSLQNKRPDLVYIEFNDLNQLKNLEKAKDIFS